MRQSGAGALLRRRGLDNCFDLGDRVDWKPFPAGVLSNRLFNLSDVDAVNFVAGDESLDAMVTGPRRTELYPLRPLVKRLAKP